MPRAVKNAAQLRTRRGRALSKSRRWICSNRPIVVAISTHLPGRPLPLGARDALVEARLPPSRAVEGRLRSVRAEAGALQRDQHQFFRTFAAPAPMARLFHAASDGLACKTHSPK